jgi:hypothetical protein
MRCQNLGVQYLLARMSAGVARLTARTLGPPALVASFGKAILAFLRFWRCGRDFKRSTKRVRIR